MQERKRSSFVRFSATTRSRQTAMKNMTQASEREREREGEVALDDYLTHFDCSEYS